MPTKCMEIGLPYSPREGFNCMGTNEKLLALIVFLQAGDDEPKEIIKSRKGRPQDSNIKNEEPAQRKHFTKYFTSRRYSLYRC